jgi:hypothetical protein
VQLRRSTDIGVVDESTCRKATVLRCRLSWPIVGADVHRSAGTISDQMASRMSVVGPR